MQVDAMDHNKARDFHQVLGPLNIVRKTEIIYTEGAWGYHPIASAHYLIKKSA